MLPGGGFVGALIAVNSFGSTVAPGSGVFWGAPYEQDGEFGGLGPAVLDPGRDLWAGTKRGASTPGANTTIGVVATNVSLTPAQARRLAIMAQDGLSRAIRPVHTPVDGDILFALSTAGRPLAEPQPLMLAELGAIAADTVARAVVHAVLAAETVGPHVSWRDRHGG
jgi:L-aminopeptidase/D-esterase-like protein